MAHPFASACTELKALRSTLNVLTYQALFGKRLEERQQASTDAVAIHDKIEAVLTDACNAAAQVTGFARSPHSYGGLFDTLDQFLELVERPMGQPMPEQSAVCSAMSSPPRFGAKV